jgi:hypothetical protein
MASREEWVRDAANQFRLGHHAMAIFDEVKQHLDLFGPQMPGALRRRKRLRWEVKREFSETVGLDLRMAQV